jgi:hypothetical protein
LSRRTLLRGAGGVSIALPLLEAMTPRRARAAAAPPTRFLVFFVPGGTDLPAWRPTGDETRFTLGPVLKPLERLKQDLIVLDGLDLKVTSEGSGHPHTRGMGGLLTGDMVPPGPYNTNGGNAGFALGTSIDQAIGRRIGAGRRLHTLEVAVRWPSDGTDGLQVHPWNTIVYSAPGRPVPPATNPRAVFDRLFRDLSGDSATERRRSRSVLDAVSQEYRLLAARVGAADRARLDAHLGEIRDFERSLDVGPGTGASCAAPALDAALDAPYAGGSNKGGDGDVDASKDTPIPHTGRLMMDMMAMAMACDLTRVGTLQWADSQANNSLPWLGLPDTHHGYQHDRGYQPDAIRKIHEWYATQFAYLLDRLRALGEGDGTLLDNTLVFWGTEISTPNTHAQKNMPFLLAGRAGGRLRTGRWLRFDGRPHNDLLTAIANLYGLDVRSYGRPKFNTSPLPIG